jgi:hypothetical protein
MEWLLSALSRHLAQRLLLRDRNETWIEFSEYELVRCLDAVFTGLGYDVVPEGRVDDRRRIDLRAQCPTCSETDPEFLIEAKFIWEGDKRLCEERFGPEVLKDFRAIPAGEAAHARHIVVWLVQSRSREMTKARDGAKTMHVGDAVELVTREHGRLLAAPLVLDAGELWKGKLDYRFMHLYAWEPGAEPTKQHEAGKAGT